MLNDLTIRKAKPSEKDFKLSDYNGLHLLVRKNGSKLWQFRYRYGGKEKTLSFGAYPSVSLSEARKRRDQAREIIRDGKDPSLVRKQIRAAASDESAFMSSVGNAWYERKSKFWSEDYARTVKSGLENDVYPYLGKIPLREITAPMVLEVLKRIEKRKAIERARRIRTNISGIFAFGIASGLVDSDPAASLETVLEKPVKGKRDAITNLPDLKEMMKEVEETSPSSKIVILALRFLALTACRSIEVRGMRWAEVDGDVWTIPKERMKGRKATKREHFVYLSKQAKDVLETMEALSGGLDLVFPSPFKAMQIMSNSTLSKVLREAGYKNIHCPHGWRASFSTIMNEKFPSDRHVIDLMLAHKRENKVEAAYNRSEHSERRIELYQIWADLLLEGMPSAQELLLMKQRPKRNLL